MKRKKENFLATLIVILLLIFIMFMAQTAKGEEKMTENPLYVLVDELNGRAKPNRKARIDAVFENGFELHPTGKWSRDHEWIQVEGGETEYVWVHIGYFSEQLTSYRAYNPGERVKIRSKPVNGRLTGYLKKGAEIEIQQVVLGWGKCDKGWIDLSYLREVDNEP